jgi:hypothetical protein
MPLRPLLVLILAVCGFGYLAAAEETPLARFLQPGESMVFQARWGIFSRAGKVEVAADKATEEQDGAAPRTLVRVRIASDGTLGSLFRYQATAETIFTQSGRMLEAVLRTDSGSRKEHREIKFDYDQRTADYTDHLQPRRSQLIQLPDGEPLDLVSCLVSARNWNLKPGEEREVLVQADRRFYPIKIRVEQTVRQSFALGEFDALVLVPEPIGEPRGVFRNGGGLRVWIEDAPRGLPLRIEAKTKVGMVTADLVEYTAPSTKEGDEPEVLRPLQPVPTPKPRVHKHRG